VTSIDAGTVNGARNEFDNGEDTITTGSGRDMIFGGGGNDTIDAFGSGGSAASADGNNIVFGDHGLVDYLAEEITQDQPLINPLRTNDIDRVWSLFTAFGGNDNIKTGGRNDIVLGGFGNDVIDTGQGSNIALGDSGRLTSDDHDTTDRSTIKFAVHDFIICKIETSSDGDFTDGGIDTIIGSDQNDVIFGGGGSDVIYAGAGDDLVFGDQGMIECKNDHPFDPETSLRPVCWDLFPAGDPRNGFLEFTATHTTTLAGSGDDTIYGQDGDDLIMGEQGKDTLYGGNGDDILIGGSNVAGSLDSDDRIDGGAGNDAIAGDNADICYRPDDTDVRFRVLSGTQIYYTPGMSNGPATLTAGQAAGVDSLVTTTAQADPAHQTQYHIVLLDHVNNDGLVVADTLATTPADRYGNDYIAGGAGNDEIFGQLGNDVIQGDGTIGVAAGSTAAQLAAAQLSLGLATGGDFPLPSGFTTFGANRGTAATAQAGFDFSGNPQADLQVNASFEGRGDGDDYIEGNGGNDVIFGSLGQDDIIGGSSDLYGLVARSQRPDGRDLVFGGAGTDIARNEIGDATIDAAGVITVKTDGHMLDADTIIGDNGRILRLVGVNGTARGIGGVNANGVVSTGGLLNYNYDNEAIGTGPGYHHIIVRAVELLDYTQGGPDFNPTAAARDIGGTDELHGESGDDFIYGQKGSDVLFGEGQDDDLIGGYGNDWISGGTGADGVIGDDGRILTSRNSLSSDPNDPGYLVSPGETLNGIAPLLKSDADPKYDNGNALNELISTPGNMQIDTINLSGALKKAVNLTPFSVDPVWNGQADPATDETPFKATNDDIIFGGLGSDWLHGGSGDDAMSGAEALTLSYTQIQDANLDVTGIAESDYAHPFNPGDALRFNAIDPNAKHPRIAGRTGEFALYDENDPMRKVMLTATGALDKTGGGFEFFLNFNKDEGVFVPAGTIPKATGQTPDSFPSVHNDGNDIIFGDNANDWIVGGTGRDHMYGGWGNDLLNADDDLTTAGGLNNVPETQPSYEDRTVGGAGKDVLIANTGGDRLIDWVGEYNSYLVPFAPFGMATVSRTMQPQLHYFLYAASLSDGIDATRFSDLNGGTLPPAPKNNDPNPGRNGEPAGELGLVLQQDAAWHGQTGAPTDPQAGNTPGTHRDVLRSANFAGNGPSAMFATAGTWSVGGGAYQNSTTAGDNVSLFGLDTWLPSYYEVSATLKVVKSGSLSNGYVIFDYQSATDFKYAGVDIGSNQIKIGQRTAAGWTDLASLTVKGLGLNQNNSVLFAANGTTAKLSFGTFSVSYTFADPLNDGMLGLGSNNSAVQFSNYAVQRLPIAFTYQVLEDFSDGVANNFTPQTGTWTATSGTTGRYAATASANDVALVTRPLAVAPLSYVEYSAKVNAAKAGTSAGLTFALTSTDNFLYAGIIAGSNQVVLGHRSAGIWYVDAVASTTISAGADYTLLVALTEGTTNNVNVVVNGKSVLNFDYNILVHDGKIGLYARNGAASFDNVLIRGDDIAYAGGGAPQVAAVAAPTLIDTANLTADDVASIAAAARGLWIDALGVGDPRLAILGQVSILVSDLPDGMLGATTGTTIVIDGSAAGWGWFVDPTPNDNAEFSIRLSNGVFAANPSSAAFGRTDLLTTVVHEMGNAMGFAEDLGQDVAGMTLQAGERRVPVPVGPAQPSAETQPGPKHEVTGPSPTKPRVATAQNGPAPVTQTIDLSVLTASWPTTLPGAAVGSAFISDAGGKPTITHDLGSGSSDMEPDGNAKLKIDWNRNRVGFMEKLGSSTETGDWRNDFLNHLGKDGLQRNPNAGLRVRPGVFSA
jgi:Ca2+-binding RTX toxin-like protein